MGLLDMLQGGVKSGLNNPLTHAGLGLLQANAKRRSYNPADLPPDGLGAGLIGGLKSYNSYQSQQQQQPPARFPLHWGHIALCRLSHGSLKQDQVVPVNDF